MRETLKNFFFNFEEIQEIKNEFLKHFGGNCSKYFWDNFWKNVREIVREIQGDPFKMSHPTKFDE